jgi:hypothetical protein
VDLCFLTSPKTQTPFPKITAIAFADGPLSVRHANHFKFVPSSDKVFKVRLNLQLPPPSKRAQTLGITLVDHGESENLIDFTGEIYAWTPVVTSRHEKRKWREWRGSNP